MSVPIQKIEEMLSISYVSTIIAKTGASYEIISRDYGIDVSIRRVDKFRGSCIDVGVSFECQLKASINWSLNDSEVIYDMEVDAYNKLVYQNSVSPYPCILVVFCLPRDEKQWINISEKELILRNCCYYALSENVFTNNSSSIRVKIPRTNIFTPEAVQLIMEKVKNKELIWG